MAYIIGSARLDERGNIANGQAGDQLQMAGKAKAEVCTENYYVHSLGWYAYRAKDASVANALAKAMSEACANSHIGYDQNQRLGVITQLAKYGTLAKIAVNTECDCSALVRACCIQAGFDPGNFTTYNEGKALEATGKFEAPFKVNSEAQLYDGDILVTCKKGHTGIIVSGRARKTAASIVDVANEVLAGKWGNGTTRKKNLTAAGYDYATVQAVVNALVGPGIKHGTTITDLTYVRTGPGTNYPAVAAWPKLGKGNEVDILKTVGTWYQILVAGKCLGYVPAASQRVTNVGQ